MADRADASSTTTTTRIRRRRKDSTAWKKDPSAWAPWKIGVLGLAGLALVGGVGTALSVSSIEDELTDDTMGDLAAAGIDTANLDVDYSYRTGTISGARPDGFTDDDIRAAVDHDGIRSLNLDLSGGSSEAAVAESTTTAADSEATTTTPTDPTTPADPTTTAAAPGATEVDVDYDGTAITLTGTVLTEDQHQELVGAATQLVGAGNVTDEIEVSGLTEATPGADDRVADLTAAMAGFGGLTSATGSLTDTDLTVRGLAPDQAAADIAAQLTAGATSVGGVADISVEAAEPTSTTAATASVDEEVASLQAELDGLAEQIRTTVVFATNSAELTPAARATLDGVVAAMQRYPGPVVEISGHTDSRGSDTTNQALSQARAQSVVDYVASQGIDLGRLSARGAGESEPIAPNETADGQAQNRRVEFSARSSF